MAPPLSLPLSLIVPVSVTLSPTAPAGPTFNQGLFIGSSTVIPSSTRLQLFLSASSVLAAGFLTTSPEYIAANLFFEQGGSFCWLGRQDLTAIAAVSVGSSGSGGTGYNVGDILNVIQSGGSGGQVVVTTVTTGAVTGLAIVSTAQGTGYFPGTGLSSTAATGGGSGCTVNITGIGESPLQALTACRNTSPAWYAAMFVGPWGTTVADPTGSASSASTALTVSSGANIAIGQLVVGTNIAAGTTVAAVTGTSVTLSIATTGSLSTTQLAFYAPAVDSDQVAMANFIEGTGVTTPASLFFITSGEASNLVNNPILTTGTASANSTSLTVALGTGIADGQVVIGNNIPVGTTVTNVSGTTITLSQATTAAFTSEAVTFSGSIGATLQAQNLNRTWAEYSTTQSGAPAAVLNPYFTAGVMGMIMARNNGTAGSYFTAAFKQVVGLAAEPLTVAQATTIAGLPNRSLVGLNMNLYSNWNNEQYTFLWPGVAPSGRFIDITIFVDMLTAALQSQAMNLLVTSNAVALTVQGVAQMANYLSIACLQSQTIGFIAPAGVWTGATIGPYTAGSPFPTGFQVYASTESWTQQQKANRQFPPFSVLIILAEAGQSIVIALDVQQ